MRITEEDCFSWDILWFAVDKNGVVGAFTSGVYGHIPEMICQFREQVDLLGEYFYFTEKADIFSQPHLTHQQGEKLNKNCSLFKDCLDLSSKGLVCYDACDYSKNIDTNNYFKISYPSSYLYIENLPTDVHKILQNLRIVHADFIKDTNVKVIHAYDDKNSDLR